MTHWNKETKEVKLFESQGSSHIHNKTKKQLPLSTFRTTVVQLLSWVWLCVILWTAGHQASLSFTISQSLLKFTCSKSGMPPNQSSIALFSSCLQSFPASESLKTKKREVISITACWHIPPFLVTGSLSHFCTKNLKIFFAEPFKVTLELMFCIKTQFSLCSLKKSAQLRSCICTRQVWFL